MGEQTVLLSIIAVFVLIAAIALCIQAAFLFGVYKTAKLLEQKVVPLVPKVDSLEEATRATVEQSRKQIGDMTTRATEILDSTKRHFAETVNVLSDANSADLGPF